MTELFADDSPDELLQVVVAINTLIILKQAVSFEQTSQRLKTNTRNCTGMQLLKYTTQKDATTKPNGCSPKTWHKNHEIAGWTAKYYYSKKGRKVDGWWQRAKQHYIFPRRWTGVLQTNTTIATPQWDSETKIVQPWRYHSSPTLCS